MADHRGAVLACPAPPTVTEGGEIQFRVTTGLRHARSSRLAFAGLASRSAASPKSRNAAIRVDRYPLRPWCRGVRVQPAFDANVVRKVATPDSHAPRANPYRGELVAGDPVADRLAELTCRRSATSSTVRSSFVKPRRIMSALRGEGKRNRDP